MTRQVRSSEPLLPNGVTEPIQPHPSGPSLPIAIEALHRAIAEHPDPQAKQALSGCLQQMLKVQANDMQQQAQGPQQPQGQPGMPGQGGGGVQQILAALGAH